MKSKEEFSILVADDVYFMQKLLVKILKLNGFTTIMEAENGVDIFEQIKDSLPDLFLVDWNMPEMDGMEVLQKLRSEGETRSIPFIMISCEATGNAIQTALASGANAYIDKPFEREEIIEKVNRLLNL